MSIHDHDASVGALVAYLRGLAGVSTTAGDKAVLRSLVMHSSQVDLADALDEFPDEAALLDAAVAHYSSAPNALSDQALRSLVNALILGGPQYDANSFAEALVARHRTDRDVVRLWAIAAHDADIAFVRFKQGLIAVNDYAGLLVDGKDHLRRMQRPELAERLEPSDRERA